MNRSYMQADDLDREAVDLQGELVSEFGHPDGGGSRLDDVVDNDPTRELPAVSRKRSRRTRPRSKTIAMRQLTRASLALGAAAYPVVDEPRPRTRSECQGAARPCPWVACKHHLYLDINPQTGSIKINFPELEPWQLAHTCALDVADDGARTLEEIGAITNLTRERVRQVEVQGLFQLQARSRPLR
jgi:hypothetical protein